MANWQEIGESNFRAANELYSAGHYRSSVSRFYYAAFSLLTYELTRKGVIFRAGRQTPAHAQLPDYVTDNLTQFTEARRAAIGLTVFRLYRLRLDADYFDDRVDRTLARKAKGNAEKLFRYFGVEP